MEKKLEPSYNAIYLVTLTNFDGETSIEKFTHYMQAVEFINDAKNVWSATLSILLIEYSQ